MKRFLIGLIAVCTVFSAQATSLAEIEPRSLLLREAFNICLFGYSEKIDYCAWANSFAATGDHEMATEMAIAYEDHFLKSKRPTLKTIDTLLNDFPRCDHILNLAAWCYYLMGNDLEQAYAIIRQIKQPTVASRDTLAMIMLKRGFPSEALQIYLDLLPEVYVDLATRDIYIHCLQAYIVYNRAGDVLYKNGLHPEAAKLWHEARKIGSIFQKRYQLDPDELTGGEIDFYRLKQKIKAIKIKLQSTNATTTS